MKILWFKDNKIGHEKQVRAILDNLALTQDLLIEERYISNPVWLELLLYLLKIKPKQGRIVIFSNDKYIHEVKKVNWGVRYTLAGWYK